MNDYMREALKEAYKAYKKDEVPVGAVIVWNDKIISRGHNMTESLQDATLHAEMIAIKKASRYLKSWRLEDSTLYVTLEPCVMCAGAIYLSRIKKVIYAAKDPKSGVLTSRENLLDKDWLNHKPEYEQGKYSQFSGQLLKRFFKKLR
ncbi:MAG: nucleoside deaminase [Candidatus Mcinerneyibacterium aminivorans]|uniref:tRNA-specific adenosine deaminase n=1 Tax=Candidatus Mcinerneyibacterium aminivorans TaxID=2703815 RepID=A0A5D0MH78_9BACT|nr:MAG: nucleoside deaminase [Candidatus Mcinerneyibacterium aminivorans]